MYIVERGRAVSYMEAEDQVKTSLCAHLNTAPSSVGIGRVAPRMLNSDIMSQYQLVRGLGEAARAMADVKFLPRFSPDCGQASYKREAILKLQYLYSSHPHLTGTNLFVYLFM